MTIYDNRQVYANILPKIPALTAHTERNVTKKPGFLGKMKKFTNFLILKFRTVM